MKNTVPLVVYKTDGTRKIIGSAEIEIWEGETLISGSIDPEYAHLVRAEDFTADFSFRPKNGEN